MSEIVQEKPPFLVPPTSSRRLREPLRLLLVEDEEDHAAIVVRAFEREGRPFTLTIASTLAEASRFLGNRSFDLVIADWMLPDGEGIGLLNSGQRFPLVLMTSYGNEQMAVEAMRSGALDYVVKSESALIEMPRIAERAMRLWATLAAVEEAKQELRVAEEALRSRAREQEWFRLVVEAAPTAMVLVEAGGRIRLVNAQAEQLFSYPRGELLGKPVTLVVPNGLPATHAAHHANSVAAPGTQATDSGLDVYGLRKDGAEVPLEIGLSTIEADEGRFVLASIVDISDRKQAEERIALAEGRFRRLLDASPVGIVQTTWEGEVLRANDAFYRMIGWDRNSFAQAGLNLRKITPEEWIETSDAHRYAACENRSSALYEKEYWRSDHSRVPVVVGLSLDEAACDDVIAVVVDISPQKRVEHLLRENERQLNLLADAMPQIVWTAGPDGQIGYFNQQWYDFTGLASDGAGNDSWVGILHPDEGQYWLDSWYASVASGHPYEVQCRFWDRKNKAYRWHLSRALPLRDKAGQIVQWVGTCTDIDNHKRLSEELEERVTTRTMELKQALIEKTTLLQEVHHRVKNNLQIICSLLNMHAVSAEDPKIGAALLDSHNRVYSMAMIHEMLYGSETLQDIDFKTYTRALLEELLSSYKVESHRIQTLFTMMPMRFSVERAVPCGLILNELMSNSLKYAFPGNRKGEIRVSLVPSGPDRCELLVEDTGIGLPDGFSIEHSDSLGLKIVDVLVKQLGGAYMFSSNNGTRFRMEFPR